MRDILKIVRFDLLTAAPFAVRGFVLLAVLCIWMGIFYAPITLAFIIFGALLFILPLNGVAEKAISASCTASSLSHAKASQKADSCIYSSCVF